MAIRININRFTFLLVIVLISISCNKNSLNSSNVDCTTYNYSDCSTSEPYETELNLLFSINNDFAWVPFEIYKGNVDDGELILRDTAWNSKITYVMPIPEKYSVRAKYERDGKIIYTIDGAELKATSTQICDSICWTVDNAEFDLMLH